ncbi:4817_t:CDS:2 [Ambispora gerdemannii]|uniref:4817_t:CDS:1 n=1 Tax=Ambispora gerdemannii TaxID=144530 RepID=A0A9N9FM47_9GLOM|nr:4817_t:CDS:2 [Ambispora gerdemannii]
MSSLAVSGIAPLQDLTGLLYLLVGATLYFSRSTKQDIMLNENLVTELDNRDARIVTEIQRILTMLNTSTARLDEIERALQSRQNNSDEYDQQSVHSAGQASNHSSASSGQLTFTGISLGPCVRRLHEFNDEHCHEENSDALNNTARLYEDACNAEDKTIKANQAEILCWCNFIIGLDKSVDESMKKAKGQIYNFILAHNPGTKRNTLYQRISRARKIYEFIEKIGIDNSKLSDSKIQTIIDYFSKNLNTELPDEQDDSVIDSEEEVSDDQTNASEAVSAEMIPQNSVQSIPKAEDDFDKMVMEAFEEKEASHSVSASCNSKYEVSEKKESLPKEEVSVPDNSLDFNLDSSDVDNVDNENDDEFSDNDEEEDDDGFCGFSDDDEGYYYDLNTDVSKQYSEIVPFLVFVWLMMFAEKIPVHLIFVAKGFTMYIIRQQLNTRVERLTTDFTSRDATFANYESLRDQLDQITETGSMASLSFEQLAEQTVPTSDSSDSSSCSSQLSFSGITSTIRNQFKIISFDDMCNIVSVEILGLRMEKIKETVKSFYHNNGPVSYIYLKNSLVIKLASRKKKNNKDINIDHTTMSLESQQQVLENFFKNNTDWSLIKFLKYRAEGDDFTYDRRKEHMLYKAVLTLLTKEHAQAIKYLSNFEVKLFIDFKMSGFKD